jgi:protein TonB
LAAFAWVLSAAPPADALTVRPDWMSRPTQVDLDRVYPPLARANEVEGGAVLGCAVAATGALKDCQIVSEYPEGGGFGEAALKLAPVFTLRILPGQAPLERVRVPITFRLPEAK